MREEQEIFKDLAELCSNIGYAHVIAFFCFRDNVRGDPDQDTPEYSIKRQSIENLNRNEISTLIGLMFKAEINLTIPSPGNFRSMINQTEVLLKELHIQIASPMISQLKNANTNESNANSYTVGAHLRESIFYGGEDAYEFQYLNFSVKKYSKDNIWLKENKGFTIEEAEVVIRSILYLQNDLLQTDYSGLIVLPFFIFNSTELSNKSGVDKIVVDKILQAFTPPDGNMNKSFNAINDFNITNSCPLIKLDLERYLLFQNFTLVEALYESPFYWMFNDVVYRDLSVKNRGLFTENISYERLKSVFGENNVYKNVKIKLSKKVVDEIDVLVFFGNRAIILQAKSKRLTLDSRKGNDLAIKEDFQKSIQYSYSQGESCAKNILNSSCDIVDENSNNIYFNKGFNEIYIICVVCDAYPALNTQVRQFLKYNKTEIIFPPFVMDVFLLDTLAEMLQSPLYFLSYINRRTMCEVELLSQNELAILAYHLKYNLWIENVDLVHFDQSLTRQLDRCMALRSQGILEGSTPDGILIKFQGALIDVIIKTIQKSEDPETIDFGFFLLTLGEDAMRELNDKMEGALKSFIKDKNEHSISCVTNGKIGLTIQYNNVLTVKNLKKLYESCERRKYSFRVDRWFCLFINPEEQSIKYCKKLDYPWKFSSRMEVIIKNFNTRTKKSTARNGRSTKKTGRNTPCPCGSGIKFKKCCR